MIARSLVLAPLVWTCGLVCSEALDAQTPGPSQRFFVTQVARTIPASGQLNVQGVSTVSLFFTSPLDARSIGGAAVLTQDENNNVIPDQRQLSSGGTVLLLSYVSLFPELTTIRVRIDGNLLRDSRNLPVDADGDGTPGGVGWLTFRTAPNIQPLLASALIVGYVYDSSTPRQPLAGAVIEGYAFPRQEADPPLPVPAVTTNALGYFQYTTPEFAGQRSFLIVVHKAGHSETLHRVDVLAGGCWRVDDSQLHPVHPPVRVLRSVGATLTDPPNSTNPRITLVIPPNALQQDSDVGVTQLANSRFLRQPLPPGTTEGVFTDIAGVFGESTLQPVTLRSPNVYNLPPGTQIPFGKVDHNTLQWADFRQLGTATVGTVDPTGTFVSLQFDHFCTCTSGYCLPFPIPMIRDESGCGDSGNCGCDGPGSVGGSSLIFLREGFLQETIDLPSLREFGSEFGLSLGYASNAAAPTVTLGAGTDYQNGRPIEFTIYSFKIEGLSVDAYYGSTSNGQKPRATWIWDGRDVTGRLRATGSYPYTIVATSLNSNVPVSVPLTFGGPTAQSFGVNYPGLVPLRADDLKGRANLINLRNSAYGAGWSVLPEHRMYFDPDGAIILVFGNADYLRFVPDPVTPHRWTSPGGDFSTLVYHPTSRNYTRSFRDGARQEYTHTGQIIRMVDRWGQAVVYSYDNGPLSRVTSPTGHSFAFDYDSRGKLSSIRDSAGRTTTFVVDAAGDLTQVADATGAVRRFVYDSEHRLVGQYGSRNERSEYVYRNGRVVTARNYDTNGTTLLRERRFEPGALVGEAGDALRNGFGTPTNPIPAVLDRIDRFIDGRGVTNLRETNDRGQTIRKQDGLLRDTRYEFNNQRQLLSRTRPNGSLTDYQYDSFGNMIRARELNAPNVIYSTTTIDYNGPFDLISRIVDAESKQTTLGYDSLGNLILATDHDGNRTTITYQDPRFPGMATRVMLPTGDTLTATYDAHGNVATTTDYPDPANNPAGRTTTYTYDDAGNLTAVTDPRAQTTQYAYDALGRVRTMTDARLHSTIFDYDDPVCRCSTPNLTGVTFANSAAIAWGYDGLNRAVTRTDQLNRQSRYTWDAESNLLTRQDRNSELTAYEYDGANQMTRKLVPGAGITNYSYDSEGSVTAASNPDADINYVYDFLSRVTSALITIRCREVGAAALPPLDHRLDYTYDRVGNRLTMQDGFGVADQVYTYDNLQRLATLALPGQGNQRWTFGYDASGRRTSLTPAPGGPRTTYAYDLAGQLTAISHNTNPPIDFRYAQYDPAGNLLAQVRQTGSQALSQNFAYDVISQLATAAFSQVFGEVRANRTYSYDAANHLVADEDYVYTYDDEGRLVRRVQNASTLTEHFAYDAEDRLRSYVQTIDDMGVPRTVATAVYGYDPQGRRAFKSVNQVARRYVHDGYDVLHEVDGGGRVERSYVNGMYVDEQLMLRDSAGGLSFYCHDLLNSVVALTDTGGNRVQQYEYEEFGGALGRLSMTFRQPFLFTGREFDEETGLLHLRARQYDPAIGRFIVEDPIGLRGGMNLYGYLRNNPLSGRDAFGQACPPKPPRRFARPRSIWDRIKPPNNTGIKPGDQNQGDNFMPAPGEKGSKGEPGKQPEEKPSQRNQDDWIPDVLVPVIIVVVAGAAAVALTNPGLWPALPTLLPTLFPLFH